MKDVMIHGDLWSANLMWKKTPKGFQLGRIIDFQLAHFGCAAEDLTRLLISTLSGKDRREHWESLLEKFHSYLVKYCDGEPPYTVEQLKESYRRFFPLAGAFILPIMDPVAKIGARKVAANEKDAILQTLHEKTQALFEDMLHFTKRNREVRKTAKP
ncbi:unnamed protein product [Heligmosomoides polygyrus]|uniref:CHK domain-containing protein n=1 Tax=Heligmosomoides polygyrus TaxID=6339 RepID=A0A183FFZ9_HELPZ|nr:unnamed protein product [Heligmosomoides polygyrus]